MTQCFSNCVKDLIQSRCNCCIATSREQISTMRKFYYENQQHRTASKTVSWIEIWTFAIWLNPNLICKVTEVASFSENKNLSVYLLLTYYDVLIFNQDLVTDSSSSKTIVSKIFSRWRYRVYFQPIRLRTFRSMRKRDSKSVISNHWAHAEFVLP